MRRYFEALYGNDELKKSFGVSAETGRLPHALIIEGAEGCGKRTLAKELIAARLCERRGDGTAALPCHTCRNCRLVKEENAADVTWIDKGDRATLGVEAVREARLDMHLSATEFDAKFYVFRDAHTMTPQAQNALLIALEEPPPQVHFILLCESADALLSTVRSRARLARMQRFTPSEIAAWLKENRPADIERFRTREATLFDILVSADGSIGKAIYLLDPKNEEALMKERDVTDALLRALSVRSFSALCDAFSLLPSKRDELSRALSLFLKALRDLLLLKRAKDAPLCYFSAREDAAARSGALRTATLLRAIEQTESALKALDRNANTATVLNVLKCALRK